MSVKSVRVAVVGGGVVGMCSAVAIQTENPDVEVTVISEKWSPNTTGDGSGGFWEPHLPANGDLRLLRFWSENSIQFFRNLAMSPEAGECGVGLLTTYSLMSVETEEPEYADFFLDYRNLTEKELAIFPRRYRCGVSFTTHYAECKKFLPFLMKRFSEKGGVFVTKKVKCLSELAKDYKIVVNCTGIDGGRLMQDKEVYPIRGQTIKVRAPWIKHAILTDDGFYILPNTEHVVLGGTRQARDWNLTVDPEDSRKIWQGCTAVMPSLQRAEVIEHWVGLRPGRSGPRVEREVLNTPHGDLQVIHNYGHGGTGVTLSWGCAIHAAQLFKESLQAVQPTSRL